VIKTVLMARVSDVLLPYDEGFRSPPRGAKTAKSTVVGYPLCGGLGVTVGVHGFSEENPIVHTRVVHAPPHTLRANLCFSTAQIFGFECKQ
jgi:hypothetical protein